MEEVLVGSSASSLLPLIRKRAALLLALGFSSLLLLGSFFLFYPEKDPFAEQEPSSSAEAELRVEPYYLPEAAEGSPEEELHSAALPLSEEVTFSEEEKDSSLPEKKQSSGENGSSFSPLQGQSAEEAVPSVASPQSEAQEETDYFISVTPINGSIAVGESLSFHVEHNYPEAKVYLHADNFAETTGEYQQSFQWHSLSADFTITGLRPGLVLISFFYEDPEHNFIRSEQIHVEIREAEGPLNPEIQQILDMKDPLKNLEEQQEDIPEPPSL
ncbi:MAG: hypothetical protein Q4B50_05445 [Bacillota bacterium]|nr:hypothetical protein [Bacillota bacterium]